MKYSGIGGYAVFCLKIACTQSGLSLFFAPFSEEKQRNFHAYQKSCQQDAQGGFEAV